MTLLISEASPHLVEADAVVIGVTKEADGALPVPGTKDVDEALGGALAQTLATLGATGEAGEVTRIPSGGRLAAPLIAAVGMGAAAEGSDAAFDPEVLRRAAGRCRPGAARRRAAPGTAVTCGSRWRCPRAIRPRPAPWRWARLLGGYAFRRYRTEPAPGASLTVLAHAGDAAPAAAAGAGARGRREPGPRPGQHRAFRPGPGDARGPGRAGRGGHRARGHRAGRGGACRGRLRRDPRRGQGLRAPAAAGPAGTRPRGGGQDARAGGQGHHVRLRRPVAQARQVDGSDEVGHERRGRGARRDAGDRRRSGCRCGWSATWRSPRTCPAAAHSGPRTCSPSSAGPPWR